MSSNIVKIWYLMMRKSVVTGWSEVLPLNNSLLSTWLSIETQFENIRYVECLLPALRLRDNLHFLLNGNFIRKNNIIYVNILIFIFLNNGSLAFFRKIRSQILIFFCQLSTKKI